MLMIIISSILGSKTEINLLWTDARNHKVYNFCGLLRVCCLHTQALMFSFTGFTLQAFRTWRSSTEARTLAH